MPVIEKNTSNTDKTTINENISTTRKFVILHGIIVGE